MTRTLTFMHTLLLLLALAVFARAQDKADTSAAAPSAPIVTISTSAAGVRYAAFGGVRQMRLEVFGADGDSLFNSGFRPGSVRDWPLDDGAGQRLPDGAYLCVVTVRDLSGRLSVRQGSVVLHGGKASLQLAEAGQAVAGAPESSPAPPAVNGANAVTLTAHDGGDGQLVSTSGALTFRTGDFFSGRDRERMRLTEDGRLGLGTDKPESALDVAGAVRARGGFVFSDGSTLGVNSKGALTRTSADGVSASALDILPSPSIVSTPNSVAKFVDGAGALGITNVFVDASGNLGVGTSAPGGAFDIQRSSPGDVLQRFFNTGAGGVKERYVGATGATSQLQWTDQAGWLMSVAGSRAGGMQLRVRGDDKPNTEEGLAASARLTILPNGNVGVGTTSPAAVFDVQRNGGGADLLQRFFNTGAGGVKHRYVGSTGSTSQIQWADLAGWVMSIAGSRATGMQFRVRGDDKPDTEEGLAASAKLTILPNGNVGVGTANPAGIFDLQRSSPSDIMQRVWNTGAGGAKLRFVAAAGQTSQMQFTDNAEWLASVAVNSAGMQLRVRDTTANGAEEQLGASARMTILRNGNVGVGTASPASRLDVVGDLKVSGNAVVAGNIAAKYQDVAEWVPARGRLAAGTVVILDSTRSNAVTSSGRAYDTHVAGVVSAQPGVILGEEGEGKVMVATTGRVKVKVDATRHPIRIGDLLVTSGAPGVAMRSRPLRVGGSRIHRPGTIIGKALEPLAKGEGEILVLLSLQ